MKRYLLLLTAALLLGTAASAQTWQVTESGWGKVKGGIAIVQAAPKRTIGETDIPRWRKTPGTLRIDFDKREAILSLDRKKDKTFYLMTESRPAQTRDGWTYVEYEALDGNNAGCRFWFCTHENGARRVLVFYPFSAPDTVYGYRLAPEK